MAEAGDSRAEREADSSATLRNANEIGRNDSGIDLRKGNQIQLPNDAPGASGVSAFTDADFQQAVWRALRVSAVVGLAATAALLWKLGWQTALLFVVGAVISCSGVYEWLRLMTVVMQQMDMAGRAPRPIAPVLIGFFMRLGIALGLLYVSLKFLHGSVYALIAGLALGVLALLFEGLRLLKNWTV